MQVGYQSISAVPSTLTPALFGRTSGVVNVVTAYTFTVVLTDGLGSTGRIRIMFPSDVTISTNSQSCASLTGTNVNSNPTCNINLAGAYIDLINLNATANSNIVPQTLTFIINGIQNPPSTAQMGNFLVKSYFKNDDAYLVATGTTSSVIYSTQASIDVSDVSIQASSYTVLNSSVTYTIKLNISNPIPLGGYF
jgi:hypothetical protein